jgi:hypothetical protein
MNLQVISPASTATSCRSPSRCPAPSATWPLHDPGKILTDLAVALGLGRTAWQMSRVLRGRPQLCGPAAPDPVISRLIGALAAEEPQRSVPAWAVASVRRFYQANGCLLYADPHVTRVDRT